MEKSLELAKVIMIPYKHFWRDGTVGVVNRVVTIRESLFHCMIVERYQHKHITYKQPRPKIERKVERGGGGGSQNTNNPTEYFF